MKQINLLILCLILTGCFQLGIGSGPDGGNPDTSAIAKLNSLASAKSGELTFDFSEVDQVNLIAIDPVLCPPPGAPVGTVFNCPLIPQSPLTVASIAGMGSIISSSSIDIDSLELALTFDPSLPNGSSCFAMAQDALLNRRTFTIQGQATLVPVPEGWATVSGTASGSVAPANDPNQVAGLYGQATAVYQGEIPPVIFRDPWVGILLTSIDSCSEGSAAPTPAPTPIAGAIWGEVTEQGTCEAAVCKDSAGFTVNASGDIQVGSKPLGKSLTASDLTALNAAANAVVQSYSPGQASVCTTGSVLAGVTDELTIGYPLPSCATGPGPICEIAVLAPVVVYSYQGIDGKTCYIGDPTAVDSLHALMQKLISEYL